MNFFKRENLAGTLSQKLRRRVRIVDIKLIDISHQNGLCSKIEELVIRYMLENGTAAQIILIAKTPHTEPPYDKLHDLGLYDNELSMYNTVIPYINTALHESLVPEYFSTVEDRTLIIERFPPDVYKSRRNVQQLDYRHCVLVFEALAKFHAASYKYRQTYPDRVPNILGSSTKGRQFIGHFLGPKFVQMMEGVLRHENVTHDVIDRLKSVARQMPTILHNEVNNRFEFIVLNHGDAKTSNFLFKYDDDGEVDPIQVKLIDFQLARWCSPAFDILFLSMSSMDYEVYEKYFNQLLDRYVLVLNETLAKLQMKVTYTRQNLTDDMRTLRYYRYVNLFFMPLYMCDPKTIASCMDNSLTFEQAVQSICEDRKLMKMIVQLINRIERDD